MHPLERIVREQLKTISDTTIARIELDYILRKNREKLVFYKQWYYKIKDIK